MGSDGGFMIRKYEPMGPPKPSATVKCLQRDQPNSGVGASVGAGGRDLFFLWVFFNGYFFCLFFDEFLTDSTMITHMKPTTIWYLFGTFFPTTKQANLHLKHFSSWWFCMNPGKDPWHFRNLVCWFPWINTQA